MKRSIWDDKMGSVNPSARAEFNGASGRPEIALDTREQRKNFCHSVISEQIFNLFREPESCSVVAGSKS